VSERVAGENYVVCVDDDPDFLRSLKLFLPERSHDANPDGPVHDFLFFSDPHDALESLREIVSKNGLPVMAISDQQMPQMKGTEFLARIREQYPDCVRVLLTGHAGLDSAITAINEHLLDKYLTKPIDNENDFMVSIQLLLQRFWMQRTINRQHRTLGDLYRFANMLSAIGDLRSTRDQVVSFAAKALGCRHASIWLVEGGELVENVSVEDLNGAGDLPARLPGDAVERLFAFRGARRADRREDVPWLEGLAESALSSLPEPPFLYSALASGDRILGVLMVAGRMTPIPFEEKDEEILTYIADTASIAIYNQMRRSALTEAYSESRTQAATLAAANERLQVLDKLKSEFLVFVSHELRTPLSVLAAVDLLAPGGDAQHQAEIVEIVKNGYQRLKRFVEKGLAYISWIANKDSERTEVMDLATIVRTAAAEIPRISGADVDVEFSFPDTDCLVMGSRAELSEVVGTLLENALKFSHDKPWIRARCEASGSRIVFTVKDRGVGFAPELADELLSPFTIADSLHHQAGSALNLAKAVAIVRAHGGDLRAASEGAGRGATFIVELPLAGAGGNGRAPESAEQAARA